MILTRQEFADKYDVNVRSLSVYVKRHKLIERADGGGIDTDDPINALFISKHKARPKREGEPVAIADTPASEVKKQPGKKGENKSKKDEEQSRNRFDIETKKKQMEISRIESAIAIEELKMRKLKGQMIPTDMVRQLFQRHFKSVTNSFKNGVDKLIVEFSKRSKMSLNDIAELRASMIQVINESVNEGIAESKADVRNLAAEHSQKAA